MEGTACPLALTYNFSANRPERMLEFEKVTNSPLPIVPEVTYKKKRLKAIRIPLKLSLIPTHYRGGQI